MAGPSTRTMAIRAQRTIYNAMRDDFEAMGTAGQYSR